MKDQRNLVILAAICLGLGIALIWNQQRFSSQKARDDESIGGYSNKLVETSIILDQQRQANTMLEDNLRQRHESLDRLTNVFTRASGDLEQTETALKETRGEMTRQISGRDARIADLESQNRVLDQHAADLGNGITNLTDRIDDTKKKLAASEGDKVFLEKELQRLVMAKAEFERQLNDLASLQAQIAKVKEESGIARRLEWIRDGLFARQEQKGGEQLARKPLFANHSKSSEYDLKVEINSEGTVKIIPPLTNNPIATDPAPAK